MNNTHHEQHTNTTPDTTHLFPPYRVVERKIGKSTFTVYSWFNADKEKDIVSTITRLIQYDSDKPE